MALAEDTERTLIGCVVGTGGTGLGGDFQVGHEIVVLESEAIEGGIEDGEGEVLDADVESKNAHSFE